MIIYTCDTAVILNFYNKGWFARQRRLGFDGLRMRPS